MLRRAFLPALAAGTTSAISASISAYGWARYIEPYRFEVTRTRIKLAGVRPRRILHISDIHMSDGMTAAELSKGFEAGLAERPNLILFTGDFVSSTNNFDAEGLRRLLRRAANAAPCYAVLGNHDGGAWLARQGGSHSTHPISKLITAAGVRLLHNQSTTDGDLTLIGLGDLWSGEFQPAAAFDEAPKSAATIVLCHNPDAKDELRHLPWNLMLSGHTHGGQARIPGFDPVWAPVNDLRYIAGLYTWENRRLFITRGLGSPMHLRAFCRPEVSILDIG